MRCLIVSDIHGNFPALQAVLIDAPIFDTIWCLGDIVGYGPDPNRCVDRLREFSHVCVAGNHDWGAIGRTDLYVFNRDARQALLWTRDRLLSDNWDFLAQLSTTLPVEGGYFLAHGSPREPIWEYLLDAKSAKENFISNNFQIAFVGHTHIPTIFEWLSENDGDGVRVRSPNWEEPLDLRDRRLILNPGSVGQPRDGDPRAAFGYLDTEAQTFTFYRTPYPVEITQERMRARGLPHRLSDRLALGR
ncbi:MAG: metallophosphoesterase family protein [Anaerolineae bacterium]